jgi:hypothetical protein
MQKSKKKKSGSLSGAAPTLPPLAMAQRASHRPESQVVVAPPDDLPVAEAFNALSREASLVSKERAVEFSADLTLALHNVRIGTTAVLPHAARIAVELPTVPLRQVLSLNNYVRGAMYAESKAMTSPLVTRDDIALKLAAMQEIRVPAILQLQVFAARKMIERSKVQAIVEGRGTLNFAQDAIDIERLFTENRTQWAGQHPFADEEIATLGSLGNWLLNNVQPDGSTPRPATSNEYDLLRRQFWAIITTLHRHLRTVGVVLWGEDGVDARIPKLQTRQVTRSVREALPQSEPAAPVVTPAPMSNGVGHHDHSLLCVSQ